MRAPRPRQLAFLAVLVFSLPLLFTAGLPIATDPAQEAVPLDPPTAEGLMAEEILAVLDAQERALAGLRREIRSTLDPARLLSLGRRIEGVKLDTERRFLEIQIAHALRRGNLESLESLEAALAQLPVLPDPSEAAAAFPPSPTSN